MSRQGRNKKTNKRKEAGKDHRSPSLLSVFFLGGGAQLAPPCPPLKESRIARRPEASRCPLALTCHSRERPLQRHGSDGWHGNGSHPGLTSARFVGANLNSSLLRLNPSPEIQIQFLKIERQITRGHNGSSVCWGGCVHLHHHFLIANKCSRQKGGASADVQPSTSVCVPGISTVPENVPTTR